QVITYDVPIEAAGLMSSGAIRIGAMIGDIHTQYHQTRPWLLLAESATYGSSAMPQKRNPGLVMRVREAASDVVGLAHTVTLRAHNVTTGMTDYKSAADALGLGEAASQMFVRMDRVLEALVVDKERALAELEAEWTTSMELADTLQRLHKVPFRIGHSFASLIVSYAREHDIAPRDFPYVEAQRLYEEAAKKYDWADSTLPLDELNFRATLSPTDMVRTRVGTGGPQPEEVNRMLQAAKERLEQDRQWLKDRHDAISEADSRLDAAFDALLAEAPAS
nr:argininosuccinate lyase [Pseudomonas sp.]